MPFPARGLAEWLAHLESLHPRGQAGIELGLARVMQVKSRLAQAQPFPVITVAGTNGKGSTCAMLERILRCAGYRTGLYTSPHLLEYNERVRIGGAPVTDDELCAAFARVEAARLEVPLTYFEFGTLAAWEVFAARQPEVVILEVGLGGRLDATNVYDPDCAIVTSIALDHMDFLGNTREAIGREKAGICRAGVPLVCGDPDPPDSIAQVCRSAGADFWLIGRDFGFLRQEGQWQYWGSGRGNAARKLGGLAFPALRGARQLHNASCVIAALDALKQRLPVAAQDIRCGLAEVEVAGRCQVIPGCPQIVLDVAHNPEAAQALAASLGDMGFARKTWAVFGCMADKDFAGVIAALGQRVDQWLPCDLPGPRAARAVDLATSFENVGAGKTAPLIFPTPLEAFAYARENAEPDDRILVFGSFLTVADVMRFLGRKA